VTLPILISLPHAGLSVPPELAGVNALDDVEIARDGDEQAAQIYDLAADVAAFVDTDIARAFVDMNRAEDDRSKDGVIKSHTCWDVPVYSEPLDEATIEALLQRYHRPYHARLSRRRPGIVLGIDCHTMAAVGPPVGPDPGSERPLVCLSDAGGSCSPATFESLALALERAFRCDVARNDPFKGGFIIRHHRSEMEWVQLEVSRTTSVSVEDKRAAVARGLRAWANTRSTG